VLDVVPTSISVARPSDDMHIDTDDSDVEPDTIAATPPPAEVSALIAARPISEIVPGQSPAQREPTEPVVAPPATSPRVRVQQSKMMEMKARRLAQKAERRRRMEQLGFTPSDDELPPPFRPTPE
jgi:hypothetical protein